MKSLDSLRGPVYRIIDPTVRWMVARGIHPNLVHDVRLRLRRWGGGTCTIWTTSGWAGVLVLLGGMWDIFDGQVARVSGMASKFGSFYDSTLDRISEIVVYMGLLSLYNNYGSALAEVWMIYVIFAAMGGSILVSYTRARAEGLGLDCKVGLMQRPERVVLIGAGSLLFGLDFNGVVLKSVIILVAVLTNLTAIQRIAWVWRNAAGVPIDDPSLRGQ